MSILNFIALGGGLALFLFGMNILAGGMEKLSSGRAEKALEKMTGNIFLSVLFSAAVTAVVQSSSLTTVVVIGMVNAGILKLQNAVGMIMGANIGTTITGQILRLGDLENDPSANVLLQILKPSTLAPVVAMIGIVLLLTAGKKEMKKLIGETCLGFGVLFQGMFAMEASMEPLQQSEAFRTVFASLQNPFLGVLAGAVITGIIQSSSASIGILQALSSTGAITFSAAFPIIMGQNIGTCATSLISSVGANKNAKRAAMVHLYFNIIGTAVFLAAVYGLNALLGGFDFWDLPIDKGGIANFHTLFNIATTILLLPFYKWLARLAEMTIREEKKPVVQPAEVPTSKDVILDERFLSAPAIAIEHTTIVVQEMGRKALENFRDAYSLFRTYDPSLIETINQREDEIDLFEDRVTNYLNHVGEGELTEPEQKDLTLLSRMVVEFERIGDYAINMLERAQSLNEEKVRFSDTALTELDVVCAAAETAISLAVDAFRKNDIQLASRIEPLEETVDAMEKVLKIRHIRRLKTGQCTIDAGLIFLEIMTQIERISDHCSNAAVLLLARKNGSKTLNRHEYLHEVHRGETEEYRQQSELYTRQFLNALPPEEV